MREPTPDDVAYRWHREALRAIAGFSSSLPPLHPDSPECGWYRRKLVKGGPFVPARIYIEREVCAVTGELLTDEILRCEVAGRSADPVEQWSYLAADPISEADYRYLQSVADHVGWYEPDQPQANPRRQIDWLTLKPTI